MAAAHGSVGAARPARTRAQRISAADAAALVNSGDWVEYGAGIGQPDVFDAALAERVDELEDVKIRACLSIRPRAVLEADPGRDHFHWFNWHYTARRPMPDARTTSPATSARSLTTTGASSIRPRSP